MLESDELRSLWVRVCYHTLTTYQSTLVFSQDMVVDWRVQGRRVLVLGSDCEEAAEQRAARDVRWQVDEGVAVLSQRALTHHCRLLTVHPPRSWGHTHTHTPQYASYKLGRACLYFLSFVSLVLHQDGGFVFASSSCIKGFESETFHKQRRLTSVFMNTDSSQEEEQKLVVKTQKFTSSLFPLWHLLVENSPMTAAVPLMATRSWLQRKWTEVNEKVQCSKSQRIILICNIIQTIVSFIKCCSSWVNVSVHLNKNRKQKWRLTGASCQTFTFTQTSQSLWGYRTSLLVFDI